MDALTTASRLPLTASFTDLNPLVACIASSNRLTGVQLQVFADLPPRE